MQQTTCRFAIILNMVHSACYWIIIKIYALLLRFCNQDVRESWDCMGFYHPQTHSSDLLSMCNKDLKLDQFQQQQVQV